MSKKNYAIPPLTNKLYSNPLPIENKGDFSDDKYKVNGDPFVMKYNGEYFCYSTGMQSVNLLHSLDLVHFEHLGVCVDDPGRYNYWAPCVIYLNGKFYMYYSNNPEGEADDHAHCLRVAVADSPYGPFIFQKQLFDLFSIDPHVIKDEDGKLYLFYSVNDYSGTDRNFAGTIILLDELLDPYTLAGKPKPVIMPSIKEEIFMKNRFGDGRDWYTIEGAFHFRKRDTEYVTYSANAFMNPTYFIGYARADRKPDFMDCVWEKYPNNLAYDPFICQNSEVIGTGHNSVVKAPNNVDDWIVYHGNCRQHLQLNIPSYRAMRIDPVLYGINKLYTVAPSTDIQDAPAEPLYKNLFYGNEDKEVYLEGSWRLANGELCQENDHIIASMYLKDISAENYILETNVKWHPCHLGGRYGMFAAYEDNRNNIQVILNEGEHSVEILGIVNGCQTEIISVKLEKDFCFEVYHKLTIKRTGRLFLLYVDDVFRTKVIYDIGKSSAGLIAFYTGADYASLELTEYLELNRDNVYEFAAQMISDSNSLEKNWVIKDGKMICYAIDSNKLLMKQKGSQYRFSVNLEQQYMQPDTYCGVYAAYYDEDNYLAVLLNMTEKKISVQMCRDGKLQENVLEPEETEMNTITVKRYGNRIIALVGSQVVLEDRTNEEESSCGLCANVRTIFSGIELLTL